MRNTEETVQGRMSEITEPGSDKGHALLFVILVLSMPVTMDGAPLEDFQLGSLLDQTKPWHDVVVRRFYGPWSVMRKRNGDYIDYNDYDALSNLPPPTDFIHDRPINHAYLNDYPSSQFGSGLSIFSSVFRTNPVGLAVFSAGVRPDLPYDNPGNYALEETIVPEQRDIERNLDNDVTTTRFEPTAMTESMETDVQST